MSVDSNNVKVACNKTVKYDNMYASASAHVYGRYITNDVRYVITFLPFARYTIS